MEDYAPLIQTNKQPKAGPRVEEVLVDPIPESLGAQRSGKELTPLLVNLMAVRSWHRQRMSQRRCLR